MKLLKLLTLSIGITVTLVACKDSQIKQENSKQITDHTHQLKEKKVGIKGDTVLKTFGDFDSSKDKFNLNIPVNVLKDSYNIDQIENISSPNINAIIIRISNGKTRSMVGLSVTDTIKQTKSLRAERLDIAELKNDGKLLVITLNSTEKITIDEVDRLTDCIDSIDAYDPKARACVDDVRIKKDKDDIFLPNDRQGSILLGL